MQDAQLPDAPLTPRHWKTLGLVLLGLLLPPVAGMWWLVGGFDAPRDAGFNPTRWQAVHGMSGLDNPRRDMVQSVGRWLQAERPGREKVRALLGHPDSSGPEADTWNIGCFIHYAFCMDGDALVMTYPGGRASSRTEAY